MLDTPSDIFAHAIDGGFAEKNAAGLIIMTPENAARYYRVIQSDPRAALRFRLEYQSEVATEAEWDRFCDLVNPPACEQRRAA